MLNASVIYDLTPFTHLDYPNHLSCIVWFSGCNMRCDYCYNPDIVFSKSGKFTYANILDFLKTRVGLLEAVVLSGGEATTHGLVLFCKEIKKLGFKIKLDTNGTDFKQIKELVELKLLDFIALDYKAPKDKFTKITHSTKWDSFSKTLDFLISVDADFEARTTLHADLLDEEDINKITLDLKQRGYAKTYYIQNFKETDSNIANLKESKKTFDKSLLNGEIYTVFR